MNSSSKASLEIIRAAAQAQPDPQPPSPSNGADPDLGTPAFSPLYRQIKGLLLKRLQSGEWKAAEVIPSEIELAAQFRVSQGTVRKAIDELAAENLLVRKQGKGTFVATHTERQVQYRFLKLRPDEGSPDDEGRAQRKILGFKRIRASAEMARPLHLRAGDPIIHIRRVLSFLEVPAILEDIWLPAQAFKGMTENIVTSYRGPTYALFEEEFDVRMVRAEEKLKAVLPDREAARHLGVSEQTALLCVERLAFTYNNTPMELRQGLYRTDTHHYFNEVS